MLTFRAAASVLAASIVLLFFFTNAVPQDPGYHAFADTRALLGVPNFWNVASNAPFLLVGVWGLAIVSRLPATRTDESLKIVYLVFFGGLLLTAFGSSWYHLAPTNETLAWDRLTMTIAFAGLFPAVVGEFGSSTVARRLLLFMLVAGPGSVAWWIWGETRGAGDLRPYAIVQFLPMLAIPAILASSKRKSDVGRAFWWLIGLYLGAKIFETLDSRTLDLTGVLSGHSLKHIVAALSSLPLIFALTRRIAGRTAP